MVNKPKNIGTAAETAVVKYLATHGFPDAERRTLKGVQDMGDITGLHRHLVVEVKGGEAAKSASDNQVIEWLRETERETIRAGAIYGILILQRRGVGAPNAGRWWAVLTAGTFVALSSSAGTWQGTAQGWVKVTYGNDYAPVRVTLETVVRILRERGYPNIHPLDQNLPTSEDGDTPTEIGDRNG